MFRFPFSMGSDRSGTFVDGLNFAAGTTRSEGFLYLVKLAIRTDPNLLWDLRYHYDKYILFQLFPGYELHELKHKERFLALAKLLVPDTHITAHNLQEPSEDAKATLLAKWKTYMYLHDKLATGNTLVPSYDFPLARAIRVRSSQKVV